MVPHARRVGFTHVFCSLKFGVETIVWNQQFLCKSNFDQTSVVDARDVRLRRILHKNKWSYRWFILFFLRNLEIWAGYAERKSELLWISIRDNRIFHWVISGYDLYGLVNEKSILNLYKSFRFLQVDFYCKLGSSWVIVLRHFKNPTLATLCGLIFNRIIFNLDFCRAGSFEVFEFLKADSQANCILTCIKRVVCLDYKSLRIFYKLNKGWKAINFISLGVN